MIRIHCLQHTESEGPAGVARWAESRGHVMTVTRFHENGSLPDLTDFDALVVMGGPMNIYQDRDHPWLKAERVFLKKSLEAGKKVVGFCLGSQLLADALGARVHQHKEYEIGWFPVKKLPTPQAPSFWSAFPGELPVLHWHGDTFELPPDTLLLASSESCPHQAFVYGSQALGFQFHLEVDVPDLKEFIGCGSDLKLPGRFVQKEADLWVGAHNYAPKAQKVLAEILDQFLG